MNIHDFLNESSYIIAAVIWVLSEIIKKTKTINENYLPLMLLPLSILFVIWINGFSPESVAQGILAVGEALLIQNIVIAIRRLASN